MRARDIMLFVICVSISAQITTTMGIYNTTIVGAGNPFGFDASTMSFAILGLAAAATATLLFNVRVPTIITLYSAMYVGSVAMIDTLIAQLIAPVELAATIALFITLLCAVIGVFGAMEISGGPHGPME